MVFDDSPELRVDSELFLRYDGLTDPEGLVKCTVLQGINFPYNHPGGAVVSEEVLYFANEEPLINYFPRVLDAAYMIGSFQVLENGKVNIISLNTVFRYEAFLWRYCYAKLVLKAGEPV